MNINERNIVNYVCAMTRKGSKEDRLKERTAIFKKLGINHKRIVYAYVDTEGLMEEFKNEQGRKI